MQALGRYQKLSKETWISTSIRDENLKTMSRWEVSFDYHVRLHLYSFYKLSTTEQVSKWYKVSDEKMNELKEVIYRIDFKRMQSNYYNTALKIGTSATIAIGQKDFHELIFINRNEGWGYLEPTRLCSLRRIIRELHNDLSTGVIPLKGIPLKPINQPEEDTGVGLIGLMLFLTVVFFFLMWIS